MLGNDFNSGNIGEKQPETKLSEVHVFKLKSDFEQAAEQNYKAGKECQENVQYDQRDVVKKGYIYVKKNNND